MVATLAPTTDLDEIRSRLWTVDAALNDEFVERKPVIRTSINALVSETHHFQLGSPGVAKSALVERLYFRIAGLEDGAFFRWLLTKFTDPGEIFGPPSLKGLKNDEYRRVTLGKLPEATIAFLDEIFKANSAILNSLLTIMNERLFFDGSSARRVALSTIFAASNETPAGEELSALYDRLHFRHIVKPVQSSSSFIRMMQKEWDPAPDQLVHIEDIRTAQRAAAEVKVPVDVYEAMRTLRDDLRKEGIEPTERRFRESVRIIRASAFLVGRDTAEVEDMALLNHVLWDRPENQPIVAKAVMGLANPLDAEAADLLDNIDKIAEDMDKVIATGDSPQAIARSSVDFFQKLRRAKDEIEALADKMRQAKRRSQVMEDLRARYTEVTTTLQEKCFNVNQMANLSKLSDD